MANIEQSAASAEREESSSFDIDDAIAIAVEAHRQQRDKGRPSLPYVTHPLRVMSAFDDPISQMIGVLHDTIEDSRANAEPVTAESLLAMGAPRRVVDAVVCLTKADGEDLVDYWTRVKSNPDALAVKRVDIDDNSDPQRLSLLSSNQRERLVEKYQRARLFLFADEMTSSNERGARASDAVTNTVIQVLHAMGATDVVDQAFLDRWADNLSDRVGSDLAMEDIASAVSEVLRQGRVPPEALQVTQRFEEAEILEFFRGLQEKLEPSKRWSLPATGETIDGYLFYDAERTRPQIIARARHTSEGTHFEAYDANGQWASSRLVDSYFFRGDTTFDVVRVTKEEVEAAIAEREARNHG